MSFMKTPSSTARAALLLALIGASSVVLQAAKQLPYVSIDNPEFISASAATFLSDGDRLIGLTSGNVAKAYPAAILAQHGVVLDQLPAGPIAVTW
jgi:hypothetical protein